MKTQAQYTGKIIIQKSNMIIQMYVVGSTSSKTYHKLVVKQK